MLGLTQLSPEIMDRPLSHYIGKEELERALRSGQLRLDNDEDDLDEHDEEAHEIRV